MLPMHTEYIFSYVFIYKIHNNSLKLCNIHEVLQTNSGMAVKWHSIFS